MTIEKYKTVSLWILKLNFIIVERNKNKKDIGNIIFFKTLPTQLCFSTFQKLKVLQGRSYLVICLNTEKGEAGNFSLAQIN